ncbi:ankyrin repeat domain-containing protein 2A isoform X2 [Cryptomeria japonica]|uniref:ankyrin repeat domain-containing protein 2A isoform X2 n=1 Tax=Cryptomeria japonica TaxID=3369 RepID=UPI0025AD29DB|nr:ankyrin repeat domain-containing protein 2A isoform X2 [Cryptomeria japonica]
MKNNKNKEVEMPDATESASPLNRARPKDASNTLNQTSVGAFASSSSSAFMSSERMRQEGQGDSGSALAKTFEFSVMSDILNDPSIKNLAVEISKDPAFHEMAQQLQESVEVDGQRTANQLDPEKYVKSMQQVMRNPQFVTMAELLRDAMMQDPTMTNMIKSFSSSAQKEQFDAKLAQVENDPTLKPIFDDIIQSGPSAVMKHLNDPVVLSKLRYAFHLGTPPATSVSNRSEEMQSEESDADSETEPILNMYHAASIGDVKGLERLLTIGADKDQKDSRGRTPLHFACGYGNAECVEMLLKFGASVHATEKNINTPLHYASAYGQYECAEFLLKGGASMEHTS